MSRVAGSLLALLMGVGTAGADQAAPEAGPSTVRSERVLTPEEIAEKESRKACKIEICAAFRNRIGEGPDIACDIVKTWREEDIEEMIAGGSFAWPWGRARCETKLKLARPMLVEAVSAPRYEMSVPEHSVLCEVDRKSEGKSYRMTVSLAPTVTFENGKAVAARVNWKEVEAPMLAYGALWPATGMDNSTNVLGAQVVKMVNEFLTTKCDEVQAELPPAR